MDFAPPGGPGNVAVRPEPVDSPAAPPGFGNTTRFLKIAAIVLLCLGAAARVRQYQARASYWADEAFILINLRQLSPAQLVGKLNWDQAAPPMFLWALKAEMRLAGEGEYAMRFLPLAGSLLGMLIFGVLARRLLPGPAALFAFGLFALSRKLVEYSAELKQYGCDATVSALLLLIALGRPERSPLRRLALTAVFASVAVWFSHPVSVVFGGVGLVLAFSCWRRSWREALLAAACITLFMASFAALFFVSIRRQHTNFLFEYWQTAFPDWRHPAGVPAWMGRQVFEFLQTPYRWAATVFMLLLGGTSVWAVRRREGERWAACAAPIAMAVFASLLRQYPFDGGRLTLFLMPELFLLAGAGAAMLWRVLPGELRVFWWALPLALFGSAVPSGVSRFVHPDFRSHIRPAVEYVKARRLPGEALALTGSNPGDHPQPMFNGRHLEALCYWPDPPAPLYMKIASPADIPERRIWVLLTFNPNNPRSLESTLRPFRAMASEKDHYVNPHGGAAYLFERPGQPLRTAAQP
ncbi:MAG TPA: glycosyltransferase family 39 protein [Tepidisphaeraceae bacterium]|jgi:hypothetical protein|nr:glycosyltransferase family 39 protein [Tepidisphaeraceae bacterium]